MDRAEQDPELARLATAAKLHRNDDPLVLLDLQRQALARREQLYGRDSPELLETLREIEYLLQGNARHHEAIEVGERRLTLLRRSVAPEDSRIMSALDGLAVLYGRTGQWDAAVRMRHERVSIREKRGLDVHLARATEDLARAYGRLRNPEESARYYLLAAELWEKIVGPEANEVTSNRLRVANILSLIE